MARPANDLTGKTYGNGMVRVVSRAKNDGTTKNAKWLCQCGCGKTFVAYGINLIAGRHKSCGCARKSIITDKMSRNPSGSLARLMCNQDSYQNLANAIVAVAADDYRLALRCGDRSSIEELESFFLSNWYKTLTDVDPHRLIALLRRDLDGTLAIVHT